MMREKTFKKIIRKIRSKTDRDIKKKYGDNYKTRTEKLADLRIVKKRYEILQLINLIRLLQSSRRLNEELTKFSIKQKSEFDMFLK
ncbi:unnamed protein product [marine sediment metagenome]|uniref:Uncharacterized protein n=1 Tax=marine sediment metagenome TaxID=412755 RepID=X1K1W5_9ZZZZ